MATPSTPAHNMKYRYLGNSGLLVSTLSLGSWVTFGTQLDSEEAYLLMEHAFKNGINFFDNAEYYANDQSEVIMGKAVKTGVERGLWPRKDLVISTKIFGGTKTGPNDQGLSRKHIIEGTKASLKRFGLDYVDLIFCHRPDSRTSIEETRSRVEFDFVKLYRKYNYGLTTWSPLASGVLTGKYNNGIPEGPRLSLPEYKDVLSGGLEEKVEKMKQLEPVAKEIDASLAQLCVAWIAANKHVSSVILGATSTEQLDENLKAMDFIDKITPKICAKIDALVQYKPRVLPSVEPMVIAVRERYL